MTPYLPSAGLRNSLGNSANLPTHTYIHRLYLKHGKPSVILHNKYSLNYSKLKNIWIHIVYIYI
jgi:hypothetical protein